MIPTRERVDTLRANAGALVGVLGPKAKFAVPYCADLLRDEAAGANAAISPGAIGPDAAPAVPALIMAVERGVPFAATALGKIGTPSITVLSATSDSGPPWQRGECGSALRQMNDHGLGTYTNQSPTKINVVLSTGNGESLQGRLQVRRVERGGQRPTLDEDENCAQPVEEAREH